jgi:hypothetical protein
MPIAHPGSALQRGKKYEQIHGSAPITVYGTEPGQRRGLRINPAQGATLKDALTFFAASSYEG